MPAVAKSTTGPRIGLALGGGGARGFAHVAVIEAIGEMGLAPTIIAGTSIGALVGAGYASGIEPADAREYARRLVGSQRAAFRRVFASRPAALRDLIGLRLTGGALLNAGAILEIAFPELVDRPFDGLAIPLKVVATDFGARQARVFTEGRLAEPLAASIALPGLFRPVEIAGRYLIDGGMTNPLPYDVIQDECDIVAAIDVTGGRSLAPGKGPTTSDVVFGSIQIMLNALVEAKVALRPPDILIRPPVDDFRVLDLFRLDEIMAAAAPVKDEVKRALDAAIRTFERRKSGA